MKEVPKGLQKQFKYYFYNKELLTRSIAKTLLATKEHEDKRGWDKIGLTTAEQTFWKNLDTQTLPVDVKKTNPIEVLNQEKFPAEIEEKTFDEITIK